MEQAQTKILNGGTNPEQEGQNYGDDIFSVFSKKSKQQQQRNTETENSSSNRSKKFVDEADMFVTSLYEQLPSGYGTTCSVSEDHEAAAASSSPSSSSSFDPFLYGEIEPVGVRQLAGFMLDAAVTASSKKVVTTANDDGGSNDDKVGKIKFSELFFVDLGSGVGKCVLDMALFCNCHVSSKTMMPPTPSLSWDDKSIPLVSSIGIELEPDRAAIAATAWQFVAVSPEQELETIKEKLAAKKQRDRNSGGAASPTSSDDDDDDDDDGVVAENMSDTFGRTVYHRTRFVHGDMLSSPCFYIKSSFQHFNSETFSLANDYRGAVFTFCCGVAFDKGMCQKIVEKVLSAFCFDAHSGERDDTLLVLIGAVFLFREWPYADSVSRAEVPQRRTYGLPSRFEREWQVKKIVLATSWMNEAPAFLLCRRM